MERIARRVLVAGVERALARGQERLHLRVGLAPFRLRILDAAGRLIVRHIDQKNARPEIDGLLVIAGIRGAVAVREVLLDLALIVAAGFRRCRREVEAARGWRRRRIEREAAERRSGRRRCGRRSVEGKRAERRFIRRRFFLLEREAEIRSLRGAAAGRRRGGRRRLHDERWAGGPRAPPPPLWGRRRVP